MSAWSCDPFYLIERPPSNDVISRRRWTGSAVHSSVFLVFLLLGSSERFLGVQKEQIPQNTDLRMNRSGQYAREAHFLTLLALSVRNCVRTN